MPRIIHWILLLAATFTLCTATPAQKMVHPEKFDRATKKDENGKLQWADHDGGKCSNCQGTGKHKCTTCERYPEEATKCPDCERKESGEMACHACAGTGAFADPLEQVLCPGCMGAGYVRCGSCPGSGILKLGDGAKRWSNCIGCRGDGWTQCAACKGKRLVESVKLKPSLAEADSATLKKALAVVTDLSRQTEAFQHTKSVRKDVKELQKLMKAGEKLWPSFKQLPVNLDWLMKSVYAASNYQGQHEREVEALTRAQSGLSYFFKHQQHILELALKRAEENEKGGEE